MREHPRQRQILLALFFFLPVSHMVEGTELVCPFSDSNFVTQNDNIVIVRDCEWGCKQGFTGRGCQLECITPPICSDGTRLIACDPPRISACVTCRQDGNEARDGGYSFGMYDANNRQYELLNGMGSFESAKLYPSTGPESSVMLVRDAVRNVPISIQGGDGYNPALQRWNDVMFTTSDAPLWDGVGTIQLQYSASLWEPGASRSDVFIRLFPLYAQFTMCHIKTSLANSHTRGLLYEFRYRQLVTYEEDIDVTATLTVSRESEQRLSPDLLYRLPPTSVWTRSRRLFEYMEQTSEESTQCLQLGFTLRKSRELLIDDVRVFSNLFWNSGFTHDKFVGEDQTVRSWEKTMFAVDFENTATLPELLGYLNMPMGSQVAQKVTVIPETFSNPQGLLTAMFSMEVRGEGFLSVRYETAPVAFTSSQSAGFESVRIVSKMFVENDFDDIDDDVWQTLTIPVDIEATNQHHMFKIEHFGDMESENVLQIDNVILYIDNERCPVKKCDDSYGQVFVNGHCEPCVLTTPLAPCPKDERISGCYVHIENKRNPKCESCPTVSFSGNAPTEHGFVFTTGTECSYDCGIGFWYSRKGTTDTGPRCEQCTEPSLLHCNVGWYKASCGGESDAKCVPCTDLSTHESAIVYTKNDLGVCSSTCVPRRFSNENSNCYACTESVCGAEQNGFSSLRILDGMQYTSKCTDTQDSRCISCSSEDQAVHFTKNGAVVGDWCDFECKAGNMRCPVCAWDQSKAIEREHISSYMYTPTTSGAGPTGEISFTEEVLVRFKGSVKISTPEYGTEVKLMVGKGVNAQKVVVLTLTPLVPPSALAVMMITGNDVFIPNAPEQLFDVTVDTRSFGMGNGPGSVTYELVMQNQKNITSTVKDFVIESVDVSTEGCCNEDGVIDISRLIRCQTCENNLPTNAYWDRPDDCTWTCNARYDLSSDGSECKHCPGPNCVNGTYWTTCDACSDCIPPSTNAKFTGPGTVRYDNASCPTACIDDFYYHSGNNLCVQCTSSIALGCHTKSGGPFFEIGCSKFENTKCVNCGICRPGSNASTSCNGTSDTICVDCNPTLAKLPTFGEWVLGKSIADYCAWRCPTGMEVNLRENICFACNNTQCGIGQYPTECTIDNDYQGCKPCQIPINAEALSVGSMVSTTSCRWQCLAEHHYNTTTNTCDIDIVPVPLRINTLTTSSLCIGSICGWGSFLNPEVALLSSMESPPCANRCISCPALPVIVTDGKTTTSAVYTRKGSCSWVCMTPLIQDGDNCVYFR